LLLGLLHPHTIPAKAKNVKTFDKTTRMFMSHAPISRILPAPPKIINQKDVAIFLQTTAASQRGCGKKDHGL
jgi:hypothetical protein